MKTGNPETPARRARRAAAPALAAAALALNALAADGPARPARIEIVEKGTDWPVPLVHLETSFALRCESDNAGLVAVAEPDLADKRTWFAVRGFGYEVPKDWLGNAGFAHDFTPGGVKRFEIPRTSLARCLGRLTGGGLFAHSQRLGARADWKENGEMGRAGVQAAAYGGKVFWTWEETPTSWSPVGIRNVSAALTPAPAVADPRPPVAPAYADFVDAQGALRGVFEPADWRVRLSGLVSLRDAAGAERLCAVWARTGYLDDAAGRPARERRIGTVAKGLCEWNARRARFEVTRTVWTAKGNEPDGARLPVGHAVRHADADGRRYVLFGDPFPSVRVPDRYEAWKDPAAWERVEAPGPASPAGGGEPVAAKCGSICRSAARGRWVAVFTRADAPEKEKSSPNREVWFAESRTPYGPWGNAVRIIDFGGYSFLSPLIHTEGRDPASPVLLFEGTLTAKDAGGRRATLPRLRSCQVLYRLDLDDPKLPRPE